ncbi:hypothetical protein QZH41_010404, partial [Actinostola sp. cb2023]
TSMDDKKGVERKEWEEWEEYPAEYLPEYPEYPEYLPESPESPGYPAEYPEYLPEFPEIGAPRGASPVLNAFSKDINACLFHKWTTASGSTTAVLNTDVKCASLGPSYHELCYGLSSLNPAQFGICYNKDTLTPSFTGHALDPVTGSTSDRPTFKKDGGTYAPSKQAEVDDYLVNKQEVDFGFDLRSNHYCAKGHLVPNADYGSNAQRTAVTFILTNAAPQWQKFNGGNWMLLEKDVRDYANSVKRKIYVFTGVGGVAPYKMNGRVQAPQYYWKLICDPVIKQMVVFVGKNSVGSWSTNKLLGCRNQQHTEERGVMQCDSLQNIKSNSAYSDFKLPDMHTTNCPSGVRGTFLDSYTNNFS